MERVREENMEVYGTDQGQTQVKQGVLGRPVFLSFFFSVEFFPREILSVHVWKTFPTALVSPPHTASHISSASPVRVFLSDTKIKTVGISSFLFFCFVFCVHTVLHWKIWCFFESSSLYIFIFLNSRRLFFSFFLCVDPELVSVCSYMCWASIMSKYLASMIWGSTLFLNTEQTEFMAAMRREEKTSHLQNVRSYQTRFITSCSVVSENKRDNQQCIGGRCTSMWVCIMADQGGESCICCISMDSN